MIFIVKSIKKGEVMHSYFQENSMMKYLRAFNFNFYSTRLYLIPYDRLWTKFTNCHDFLSKVVTT